MDSRVQAVCHFVETHLTQAITLEQMARCAGLSRPRFCHLFKTETGMSPSRYVKRLRNDRAAFLLAHSALSVKEIAFVLGYQSVGGFVRSFRSSYGLSPGRFRTGFRSLKSDV